MFRSTDSCFEHIVKVSVSRAQEEIVHVPAVVNNHRHHHVEQKVIVDFHVPHEKEEIVQGPKMIPQERVFQRHVEQIVEAPMPMAQKEMVLVPTVVHHRSQHHVEQEVIVDDHVPQEKEETIMSELFNRPFKRSLRYLCRWRRRKSCMCRWWSVTIGIIMLSRRICSGCGCVQREGYGYSWYTHPHRSCRCYRRKELQLWHV